MFKLVDKKVDELYSLFLAEKERIQFIDFIIIIIPYGIIILNYLCDKKVVRLLCPTVLFN